VFTEKYINSLYSTLVVLRNEHYESHRDTRNDRHLAEDTRIKLFHTPDEQIVQNNVPTGMSRQPN